MQKTITEQIEGMGSNLISVNIISIDRQIGRMTLWT